jgi:hypothetical protein
MQDEEGGSLAGTSTDGVLGAVEFDDDAVGARADPSSNSGSGNQKPAEGEIEEPAIVGRHASFADGLAVSAASDNGGSAAGNGAAAADPPPGRGSWDGFKP